MSWGEAEFDGLFERLGGDDVRCPEEPLRENEAEAVYRALEVAKAGLRRIRDREGCAGAAWTTYVACDVLTTINDIMKGAR